MGKILETKISRFDGGMLSEIRSKVASAAKLFKGFDILSYSNSLHPINSSESGNDAPTTAISTFLYAESKLWGLGVKVAGGSIPKIFWKNTYNDAVWTSPANGEGTLARDTNFFAYYKSAIYGFQSNGATGRIYKFATSGGAFTETDLAVNNTAPPSNGVVHSKDDMLYVGIDDKIYRKTNDTAWDTGGTGVVLTLSSGFVITSICEYGNSLAIGGYSGNMSRVFLWDLDAETWNDSIDWGEGYLQVLEELEGNLMGISYFGNKVTTRYYAGVQGALEIPNLEIIGTSPNLSQHKQKTNGRLYFLLTTSIESVNDTYGVWSIGKNKEGKLAVALEYLPNNNTAPGSIQGFYLVDNYYMFIGYIDGASAYQVSKTAYQVTTFSVNAIYESFIFDAGDPSQKKDFVGATVTYVPLPTAGSVTLKYKRDAETSFTTKTIFTDTTNDSISHSAINIESTGEKIPEHKEIQFQITSTGGAIITGFSFQQDITGKRLY